MDGGLLLISSTIVNNLLIVDGVSLIAILMDGYNIDFAAIIKYEIHERAFGELTILLFL